jgi:competence protein ComEA
LEVSSFYFLSSVLPLGVSLSPSKVIFAIIFTFIAGYLVSQTFSIFFQDTSGSKEDITQVCNESSEISIEVTGAVTTPGVYELKAESRVIDAIKAAGDFTSDYDYYWVSKNINLSQIIKDEQKIFIPFSALGYSSTGGECSKKVFLPVGKSSVTTSESTASDTESSESGGSSSSSAGEKINVNEATLDELDTLPGIGAVYAEKIIAGRPYSGVEDFKEKSQVTNSVYEKIKDLISF